MIFPWSQVDETFSAQNFPQSSEDELRLRRRTWAELLRRFQRRDRGGRGGRKLLGKNGGKR